MKIVQERFADPDGTLIGGGIAPFIICDVCGDKVIGQHDGMVMFVEDNYGHRTGDLRILHKGRCDVLKTTTPWGWLPLDVFLRDIIGNAQIDLNVTEARIRDAKGFGFHI